VSVLFVIVPVALALVGAAIAAFVWAARRGQFDDMTTPAMRALIDDEGEPAGAETGADRDARDAPDTSP